MSQKSDPDQSIYLNELIAQLVLKEVGKTRRHANYRMAAIILFGIAMIVWNSVATRSLLGSRGLEVPKNEPYVSLVRIRGEIGPSGSASAEFLKPALTRAFMDENATGVVLLINSRGGTPVQSDLLHDFIIRMKETYGKKVVAIGEDQMTSGAYMTAVAADRIFVNEATLAGSIGVVMNNMGYQELARKVGVESRVFTAGQYKYRLDPFSDLEDEDVRKMQEALDTIHQHFIDTVRVGRGDRLAGEPGQLFSGDWWTGEEVVELGLADGIADLETVMEHEFGVKYALDYSPRKGLLSGLTESLAQSIGLHIVERIESTWRLQTEVPQIQ